MLSSVFATTAVLLSFAVAQSDTVPVTGKLGNATCNTNNPPGVVYTATLPEKPFANLETNIKGSISGVGNSNGIGVLVTVDFSNFPQEGGPFLYHIHDAPVPSDGNCTGTLAHLDPYQRGETPPCDPNLPQTCQVGDLSGKYGAINTPTWKQTYNGSFISVLEGDRAFFGNRSVTIHFANKTRITCANFTLSSGTPGSVNLSSSMSTSTSTLTGSSSTITTENSPTTTVVSPSGTGSGTDTGTVTGSASGGTAPSGTATGGNAPITTVSGTTAPSQITAAASGIRPALYTALFGAAVMMAWML